MNFADDTANAVVYRVMLGSSQAAIVAVAV